LGDIDGYDDDSEDFEGREDKGWDGEEE
jgi:hypothetical protein